MRLVNPKNNERYSVEFIILIRNFKSLLRLPASQQMKLLSINKQNISAIESSNFGNLPKSFITSDYQNVFKGEGNVEDEIHLEIDETVRLFNCRQDKFQYQ